MTFSEVQVRALASKLSPKHVRTRQANNGFSLSYIEGWHAIAEANRIFGFDAWDRQTMSTKCVWHGARNGKYACSYVARVRVKVRAADILICREGCGSGHGLAPTPGEAHESALKEAETDAMKRALATFGNPFGLALYDKEKRGVRGNSKAPKAQGVTWVLLSEDGQPGSTYHDPVDFCAALRKMLEETSDKEKLKAIWARNLASMEMLRQNLPDLKSEAGQHYSDILRSHYHRRLRNFEEAAQTPETAPEQKTRPAIDKTALTLSEPKRVRDKDHLRFVASLPCLICGRAPGHAHHLRFAQPSALGRKVSDEWVVPLCATHHQSLHHAGNEENWWNDREIDPIPAAQALWLHRKPQDNSAVSNPAPSSKPALSPPAS